MEKLRISADGRHFETESGIPFFYLADTVWTMPTRLKWDDAQYLMDKRKAQGFTVLQIVALDPEFDGGIHSPSGEPALYDMKLEQRNEAYFRYLDWLINEAEKREFYILLLPVWGQMVVGENWGGKTFEKTVTEDNSYEYGRWLGERYKDKKNILWCLGGDRQPIHNGIDYRMVWRNMAEGIAMGVLGKELHWNIPDPAWREVLMTYHPCYEAATGEHSTTSYWTEKDVWIDFVMNQSGHNENTPSYIQIRNDYESEPVRPVFDGEPAYEEMPTGWGAETVHGPWMIRKRAYWSLFAGSFGHTYGHCDVWCMISEKEKNQMFRYSWFEALDHEGAWEMAVLKEFMMSRPYWRILPAQDMIGHDAVCRETCLDDHRQACVDKDGEFAFVYFSSGGTEEVDLARLKCENLHIWWFHPATGICTDNENKPVTEPLEIKNTRGWESFTTPSAGKENDWILVLEDAEKDWKKPGMSMEDIRIRGRIAEKEAVKVFGWG